MKLPIIVVFNKCDKADAGKLVKWMKDYESFLVKNFLFLLISLKSLILKKMIIIFQL